jgi:ATP-binding cassette subfamily B protein
MKNMTTLIITNRLPTIELCDEVIFIENGKVKAQGKHEDIIKNDEAYMNLFLEEERLGSTK